MAAAIGTRYLILPLSLDSKARQTPRAPQCFSIRRGLARRLQLNLSPTPKRHLRLSGFTSFVAQEETAENDEAEIEQTEDTGNEALEDTASNGGMVDIENAASIAMASLQSLKKALANNDQSRIADAEAFLQSIEDEKKSSAGKVAKLSAELAAERERVLRISADFDNFRKRTERDRLSLVANVRGEVLESLLPVLDNFERAKTQIKVEMEGEGKISNSYQSIYKQLQEILNSLGVESVETVGNAFDPLLHEAIMQEESIEFEEGIILQEFRKGFKLGERLLRPSMVKVSAGPGPAKVEAEVSPADQSRGETSQENTEGGGEPA